MKKNPERNITLFTSRRALWIAAALAICFPLVGVAQEQKPAPVALPEPIAPAPAETTTTPAAPAPSTSPPGAPATRLTIPARPTKDGILLNFQGAALGDVLNYLSEAAGFVIIQEAPVTGTVNVVSRQPLSPDEAVDLVNAVLVEKGYIALRAGRILKIVSRRDAQKRDLPVATGSDPEKIPRKDEMVTQILPLLHVEATKLVENIRPLLQETATISANENSNAIMLTDTQTNIRRIAQIIQALDTSVSSAAGGIRVFPLQFADAKEVATIVTQLFAVTQSSRTGGDRRRELFAGFGGGGGGDRGGGGGGERGRGQSSGQSEARQAATRVVAVADEKSNSLIVSASDGPMATIAEVVAQLDTSINDFTENRIFRLLHADAMELAETINTLYAETATDPQRRRGGEGRDGGDRGGGDRGDRRGGTEQRSGRALLQSRVVAVADARTNSIVVTAARETMIQISEMVGRLDATDAKKQRVYVHSLEHADADSVAGVLRGMLGDTLGSGSRPQDNASRLNERSATGATMDATESQTSSRARR